MIPHQHYHMTTPSPKTQRRLPLSSILTSYVVRDDSADNFNPAIARRRVKETLETDSDAESDEHSRKARFHKDLVSLIQENPMPENNMPLGLPKQIGNFLLFHALK